MAIHTELPIYKVAYDLLGVVIQLVKNMPREVKQSIGGTIRDECISITTLVFRANVAQDKPRQEGLKGPGARTNAGTASVQPEDTMQTIIAKWIFTAAATLMPGTDQGWPRMAPVRAEGVLESIITTVLAPPPEGCELLPAGCTVPPVPRIREFCIPAGAYQVTARIGLQPLGAGQSAEGRLWIRETGGTGAGDILVATFFGAPGAWTVDGGTGLLVSGGTCYSWRYDLTGSATVNPDPRVTYLAIVRVAE